MTINELRAICQKDKLEMNTGLTLHNRKISIYVSWLFIKLKISANQATLLSLIFGIVASVLFIFSVWWLNFISIFLLWFSFTLDQVDGELARYYKSVNLNGVYLDEIRHILIYSIPYFCYALSLSQSMNTVLPIMFGFIGSLVMIINRVEERLPSIIYTDKIVLKRNFTFGEKETRLIKSFNNKNNSNENEQDESKSIIKKFIIFIYGLFSFCADQAGILVLFTAITIVDTLLSLSLGKKILWLQTVFVFSFSTVGLYITCRTVYKHWEEKWIVSQCRDYYNRAKGREENID